MTMKEMQQRLEELERKVEQLERSPANGSAEPAAHTGKWWVDYAGRFKDNPVFEEIVRLGRKYRESLRPKPRRRGKSKRAPARH